MRPRFTYSRWDGTQQGFDLDAHTVLEQITDELLYHGDVNTALRRMMQQGLRDADGQRSAGLREMLRRVRERRAELLENTNLDSIYRELADELGAIIDEERRAVEAALDDARASGDERRASAAQARADERNFELGMLPDDIVGRLLGLKDYDFESADAQRRFEELVAEMTSQLMQRALDRMSSAVADMTPEQMGRTKDMLAALNEMLERRARDEDPRFEQFMEQYGDFFPENPGSLDELLEAMARRMAAMDSMLNSMSPEQRAQLEALSEQLLGDMDLRWQLDQLGEHLRTAFPQLNWERVYDTGDAGDPMNLGEGLDAMMDAGELDELERLLGGTPSPGALAELDFDRVSNLLGEDSAESLRRLSQLAQMLENAGLVTERDGRLQLTPQGMRQIGSNSLRDLFGALGRDRAGRHEVRERGSGHERSYDTKPYEYGDPFHLDLQRTIRNALRREVGIPVRLDASDFEIEQTEHLARTATVLMLDLSQSMLIRDNFLPAKKVTMALHSLIASQYPRDYLGVVGFASVAQELRVTELPEVGVDRQWGTNMQHGFALARRLLQRAGHANRQIVMITDGEPTAHLDPDQGVMFNYPPTRETVEATIREVVRCTRDGIRINSYVLDVNDYLRAFIEHLAAINHGRVFYTTPDRLGEYVLVDFLEHRRATRRRRAS